MNLKLRVVRLPEDAAGFIRRECSACHRQFKTKAWPSDSGSLHRRIAEHLPHENPDELFASALRVPVRSCPYCGRQAAADAYLTAEQRAYLEHLSRAYANLIRHESLMQVHRTLSQNPYPTFVPVKPEAPPPPLRDDADTFRLQHFVCCNEELRVEKYWRKNLYCCRCGAEHRSQASKAHFMLPQARG